MMRLTGLRAIVTGAASGIGKAAASLFAAEGAQVLLADRDRGVEATAADICAGGGSATAVVCDVSDEMAVQELVARSRSEAGGLEIMFANAGVIGPVAPVLELTAADWRQVLDVNLLGAFACVKHAGLHMRDNGGGSIVCTASVAGLRSGAGPSPYSASKAAVINLVQTAAWQLSGSGV